MNPTDYTNLPLRDIHLPGPVVWWPPAYGWWMLGGLVLLAGLGLVLRYRSHYRERAALRGLRAVAAALAKGGAPVVCIQRISMILRRFAMSVGGAAPVAGLTGESWLRFLDSRWTRDDFSSGAGRVLIFGPYARPDRVSAGDVSTLNQLCVEWIRAQRPLEQQPC
jgi:Domain of unknown function (DUF4381)